MLGPMTILFIALGGASGAVARYLVDGFVVERTGAEFPWGTFVINISGSFVLGLLYALAIESDVLSREVRAPLMIGFLGAYTTFSTWMLETWRLAEDGAIAFALANIGGSIGLGIVAVFAGLTVGRFLA
jgi:fluoride exporter